MKQRKSEERYFIEMKLVLDRRIKNEKHGRRNEKRQLFVLRDGDSQSMRFLVYRVNEY